MNDRLLKIEELRDEIQKLEREQLEENKKNILPFLQSNKVTITYTHGCFSELVVWPMSDDDEKELLTLCHENDDISYPGDRYFRHTIHENTTFQLLGDEYKILFSFSGLIGERKLKLIAKIKELKLKIDFSEAKYSIQKIIDAKEKALSDIKDIEDEISGKILKV